MCNWDIKRNVNCIIKSNKSGDKLETPCPLNHLKKYFKRQFREEDDESMGDSTAIRPEDDTDVRQPDKTFKSNEKDPINSLTISVTTCMEKLKPG